MKLLLDMLRLLPNRTRLRGQLALGFAMVMAASSVGAEHRDLILVTGTPGTPDYQAHFSQWRTNWIEAVKRSDFTLHSIGADGATDTKDREILRNLLASLDSSPGNEVWLVLIGHGTYARDVAKFNLRGPDVSASELAEWLAPIRSHTVVVNCASASAPFINRLSATNRVVVTATRSGHEINFTRFGGYVSQAIGKLEADLDRDGQVSVLEATLWSANQVKLFYENEGRLLTEHALIDDNGDGLGTPAEWFRGIYPVSSADDNQALDGFYSHQRHLILSPRERALPPSLRTQRDELEMKISQLRLSKPQDDTGNYYDQLEVLLLELARLYRVVDGAE